MTPGNPMTMQIRPRIEYEIIRREDREREEEPREECDEPCEECEREECDEKTED